MIFLLKTEPMKSKYYLVLIFLFLFFGKTSAQFSDNAISPAFEFFCPGGLFFGPSMTTTNYFPLSNYHFFNPYYYNPAMAGIEDKQQLNLDWNRQHGHSALVSYEQPISAINSAIGIHYSYTSNEFSSASYYGLAYNYGFTFKNKAQLKLGVQISQVNLVVDEWQIGTGERKEKWYNSPVVDFGFAFQKKRFRVGLSVQNISPTILIPIDSMFFYENITNGERQVNFSIANTFKLSKQWDWSLALLIRSSNDGAISDWSSYVSFRKKYFVGTTFRTAYDYAWIGFAGIKIKEKVNLHFSWNGKKDDYDDRRYFEVLGQYEF